MNREGIQKVFSEAADTYQLVNHVLTLGLDVAWRKRSARIATQGGTARWLDVCSGTGDMSVSLRKVAKKDTKIIASDISFPMMRKAILKPGSGADFFCISDSGKLPFSDNTFDVATISFATRNINAGPEVLARYFREFRRILKPGGMFINLETSQPRSKVLRYFFHTYIRIFIPLIGYLISGSKIAYQYLSYTIPRFFTPEKVSAILYESGFSRVTFLRLTLGICAIHTATK